MAAGAGSREGGRYPDDVTIGRLELLGQVDLGAGRLFVKHLEVGNLVAHLDKGSGGRVEATRHGGTGQRGNAAEGGSERHFDDENGFDFGD